MALINLNMVDIQSLINIDFKIFTEEYSEIFKLIEYGDFNATKLWLAYKSKSPNKMMIFSVLKGPSSIY